MLVIVNPISGTKGKEALIREMQEHPMCEVVCTRGPGQATRLATEAVRSGARGVIAVGGDGTVREAAIALVGGDVPLGIIPAGSGNGLARHLHIPMNPRKALELIGEWHVCHCDYGIAHQRPFFCTMGVGFDAEVSHRFAQSARRGSRAYAISTLNVYNDYKPEDYRIHLPGLTIERRALLVTVANASQYGNGAMIAPGASVCDGLLDVTLLLAGDHLRTIEAATQLFTGRIHRNPLVETYRVPRLRIERETAGHAHFDGEAAELPAVIDIEVMAGALPVLTLPDIKA